MLGARAISWPEPVARYQIGSLRQERFESAVWPELNEGQLSVCVMFFRHGYRVCCEPPTRCDDKRANNRRLPQRKRREGARDVRRTDGLTGPVLGLEYDPLGSSGPAVVLDDTLR